MLKRTIALTFIIIVSLAVMSCNSYKSVVMPEDTGRILRHAEDIFIALKTRHFADVWGLLTEKSKATIVREVYNSSRKMGAGIKITTVTRHFETGSAIAESYWNAFLENFDPDWILRQSKWDIGYIKSNSAELSILYKRSDRPVRLRMFLEDGIWKVGLVETFWARKLL